jgi:hypothetical protein
MEVFELAMSRADGVKTVRDSDPVIVRYRRANANLRTQLQRILKRAGVEPWPRLFQNLRSTRETELAGEYPLHVVTYWIGNTARIAAKHYLQVPDEVYAKATQNAAHGAQKQAQQACAMGCSEAHGNPQDGVRNADFAIIGAQTRFAENKRLEAGGFEPDSPCFMSRTEPWQFYNKTRHRGRKTRFG